MRISNQICDGCRQCFDLRYMGKAYSWCCGDPYTGKCMALECGDLAPIWCPIYKAQVRERPLVIVTAHWDVYRDLKRRVRIYRTIPAIYADRLRGLRGTPVWYADTWWHNSLVLEHNPILTDVERPWR